MIWIAISIPVMVLALAIATVPLIFAMVAEQKLRTAYKSPLGPTANGTAPEAPRYSEP